MQVLIVGAGGMIGRKLSKRLAGEGALSGRRLERLTLADVLIPSSPGQFHGTTTSIVADLAEPNEAEKLVATRPDVIFHLAAVVSGEAETNFEKGYRANLDGTRFLLEAIRRESARQPYRPRLVLASSIAVFGAPFPEKIGADFLLAPLTSYGAQKAIAELLLADYSRHGFVDGIGIRLPTICIRPGAPNKAASGFFSNILREPLVGREATLPVSLEVRHWFASPRAAVRFLIHAANIDLQPLGSRTNLTMPGLSATIGEEIDSLRRIAGEKAVRLIRREPNAEIVKIVEGWPRNFDARRAQVFGLRSREHDG
jgi:nucleoside-diphosphate-sugar epimerase